MSEAGLTYEQSGVSIDAQDRAIEGFKAKVERSYASALQARAGEVIGGVGSFGALFAPDITGMKRPVLVSSTDGIGTKVRLHARFGTHEWAGEDLVSAVTNDVLCQGARPMFFLDYIACNKVDPGVIEQTVSGMATACAELGCALIGGEIAEMGDTYNPGEYDLAGFAIGLADEPGLWGPQRVEDGDVLVGIASNGVHCNGFSLVRRVFEQLSNDEWLAVHPELEASLHNALLRPTRCYAKALTALRSAGLWDCVHAAAHISGGGLEGNLPRSIPSGLGVGIDRRAVRELAGTAANTFDIIERSGRVPAAEMWRVFNMGVGFVLVTAADSVSGITEQLAAAGFSGTVIGCVRTGQRFEWTD